MWIHFDNIIAQLYWFKLMNGFLAEYVDELQWVALVSNLFAEQQIVKPKRFVLLKRQLSLQLADSLELASRCVVYLL